MQALGLLTISIPKINLAKDSNHKETSLASVNGFLTDPYIQNLTAHSVTIQIITHTNSYSWVEYGVENLEHTHFESKHGLKIANCRFFQFKLQNLKPNTTYIYKIHTKAITKMSGYDVHYDDEVSTTTYSFKTLPLKINSYKLLVFNDIHDRKESYLQLWNCRKQQNTDLVVFNGDIFNQLTTEKQIIDNFLNPISELFSTHTPFIFNRGNHETRGLYARESNEYFDLPRQLTYQSFLLGSVYWIFLDSGEDKPDNSKEYFGLVDFDKLRLEQRDWLLEVVQSKDFKNAKFRAVVMHMPPIHAGNWHGPTHCKELFIPIFNANKIDIVYSGHTHQAKFHPPAKENKFALFIGGGPKDDNRTILDIEVTSDSLNTYMINDKGSVIEEWKITR